MASYGKYRSVNILAHFADVVAEHGPFDPNERVQVILSRDGRYTIGGADAFDENGFPKYYLDLRKYLVNTIDGVRYLSNGALLVDSDNKRYAVYISDTKPDYILPYAIHVSFKAAPDNYYFTQSMDLPSDHPFLQAFKRV
ncbi:hypothetical protein ST201phi2-1p117 [Pseudomonas phage 201phi2-1]|uniref:Uncharacterized protein n=1 Tax=Pseudomonas phage 201phi2-1 TaxID=198110 RepID=B3FIY0_BP201|nr:hypothetical protein ST201phi2-1p117 [Pseudomonas phage 201phi2-1]ABY62949.1 hypothetical protein 201phi2-1p117 [Pseudomonas phage 201phi2-1]